MNESERNKWNYQYYLSRGLCPHCGGKNKVEPKRNRCRECAIKNSESKRKMRETRIAEGRCVRCGGPLGDSKYKTCEKCRAYNRQFEAPKKREQTNQRYHAYKEAGICVSCGRKWAEPGHVYCAECRVKNKRRIVKQDPTGDKKREFRQARIDAGLCIDCGRPTVDGKARCNRCIEMRRDSTRKYEIHKRIQRDNERERMKLIRGKKDGQSDNP